jgi:hypothetical protein
VGVRRDHRLLAAERGREKSISQRLAAHYHVGSRWPAELMDVALCDRMGVSWLELQEIPECVVQDYLMVMAEEARHAERQRKAAKTK